MFLGGTPPIVKKTSKTLTLLTEGGVPPPKIGPPFGVTFELKSTTFGPLFDRFSSSGARFFDFGADFHFFSINFDFFRFFARNFTFSLGISLFHVF